MQEKLNKLLKNSYSPYSKVQVSAILIDKDGKEYSGVNIENASYTPTVCAERVAIFSAIKEGKRKGDFKEIHLSSNTNNILYPCGVCRQVMSEFFEKETNVHVWHKGQDIILKLADLIPFSVTDKDLK